MRALLALKATRVDVSRSQSSQVNATKQGAATLKYAHQDTVIPEGSRQCNMVGAKHCAQFYFGSSILPFTSKVAKRVSPWPGCMPPT